MPRCKKDYKNLNIKLQREISDQFEAYCEELGQTKTTALERILTKHLIECGFIQNKQEIRKNVAKEKNSPLD